MEYNSGSPIYLQVINELKKKMVKGELKRVRRCRRTENLQFCIK